MSTTNIPDGDGDVKEVLLRFIGGAIGSARIRRTKGGKVTYCGILGKGDVAWYGLLGLCARLQADSETVHGAMSAAFPELYAKSYIDGQLAIVQDRLLRGEFVPKWGDLVIIVPGLDRYTDRVKAAMMAIAGGK